MQHLTREYGYVIDLVVGHSRGSVAGLIWLCRYPKEEMGTVRGFVNVSGRYRMSVSEAAILYDINTLKHARQKMFGELVRRMTLNLVMNIVSL